ncbi:hypothetical protein ACSLPA_32925, partial [Escherichia coli]
DAAFKLAQFTHRKIGSIGKKEVKKLNAASVYSNRFPIPKPPTALRYFFTSGSLDSCQPLTLAVFSLYPACIAASVGFAPLDNA